MIHQKKNRGHQTSKIVKSRQSYSNGHLLNHLFILLLSARIDAWHGVWICVHSKDIRKQLVQTSWNDKTDRSSDDAWNHCEIDVKIF